MTKLEPGRPVIRETDCYDRGVPLIEESHPKYVTVRLKGYRNTSVNVPWDAIYDLGRKLAARETQLDAPRQTARKRKAAGGLR